MLPRLIFLDDHLDIGVTVRILAKLVPKVEELGYRKYYEELPKTFDSAKLRVNLEFVVQSHEVMSSFAKEQGFEEINSNNISDIVDKFIQIKAYPPEAKNQLLPQSQTILASYEAASNYIKFLDALHTSEIIQEGIDLPDTDRLFNIIEFLTLSCGRDFKLMSSFLKATEAVFGRTGWAHAAPIVQYAIEQTSEEFVKKNFCFINLYSLKVKDVEDEVLLQIKSGKITDSISVLSIDANKFSDEEIVEMVLKHVSEKQFLLKQDNLVSQESKSTSNAGFFFSKLKNITDKPLALPKELKEKVVQILQCVTGGTEEKICHSIILDMKNTNDLTQAIERLTKGKDQLAKEAIPSTFTVPIGLFKINSAIIKSIIDDALECLNSYQSDTKKALLQAFSEDLTSLSDKGTMAVNTNSSVSTTGHIV